MQFWGSRSFVSSVSSFLCLTISMSFIKDCITSAFAKSVLSAYLRISRAISEKWNGRGVKPSSLLSSSSVLRSSSEMNSQNYNELEKKSRMQTNCHPVRWGNTTAVFFLEMDCYPKRDLDHIWWIKWSNAILVV